MGTPVHFLDIGMIIRIREHARNGPALARHPQSEIGTEPLDPILRCCRSGGHNEVLP